MLDSARQAYAPWLDEWNEAGARAWLEKCVSDDVTFCVRGEQTAGIAQVLWMPWAPSRPICDLVHLWGLGGENWEAVWVVRKLDEMRIAAGCAKFYVGSVYRDLSPIARRLGGRRLSNMWVLEG